jgi:hypothetical protein
LIVGCGKTFVDKIDKITAKRQIMKKLKKANSLNHLDEIV